MADSYVKDAFLFPANLGAVAVGTIASVAIFPPALLGVAVLEGIYLWNMSTNPRFQRVVRSRRGR